MGFELVPNFDTPYLSTSLQAFWRRWHISLSTWIRDYIYVSLGGKSVRRAITYRNLVLTMLAGGLWHGAAWTFVAWGGLHGLGLVVQQEFARSPPGRRWQAGAVRNAFGWLLTLQFVCLCWILFRAPTFSVAIDVMTRFFNLTDGGGKSVPLALCAIPPLLLASQYLARKFQLLQRIEAVGLPAFSAGLGATAAFAIAMLPLGNRPFIYFQF
jgi:alginate O-acetyltransferase complex protein AlgI